jgi:hypothetical protein
VASGQDGLLAPMARRALEALGKKQPRVAVTHAPVEGDAGGLKFMSGRMAQLFPGALIETIERDRSVVDRADLIFVSGGDPTHGAKVLAASGAATWIREASARGVPTMGVSAGAILLGQWWVDWPEEEDAPAESAELVACTGVIAGHVFDTHDEADGWEELHVMAGLLDRAKIQARLLGIPTGGALVYGAAGRIGQIGNMEVVGIPPYLLR